MNKLKEIVKAEILKSAKVNKKAKDGEYISTIKIVEDLKDKHPKASEWFNYDKGSVINYDGVIYIETGSMHTVPSYVKKAIKEWALEHGYKFNEFEGWKGLSSFDKKTNKVSKKAEDSEYESIDEIFKEEKLALQKLLGTKEPIYKSDLIFELIPVFTIGDSNDMYAVSANEQDIKRAVEDSLENLFDGMRVDEFVEKVIPYIGSRDVNDYMEDYEENDPYVWGYKYTGSVDFEKMAEDVINEYGAGHELAPYDGRTDEIGINGKKYYIFRQQ